MVSKTLRQPALCPAPASLLWCAGLPEAAAAAGGCSGRGGGCCCSLATSLAGSLALAWPGERCFSHLLTSGLVAGEAGSWHTETVRTSYRWSVGILGVLTWLLRSRV